MISRSDISQCDRRNTDFTDFRETVAVGSERLIPLISRRR